MSGVDGPELQPRLTIQEDERACLSAALLSLTDPELRLTEYDVSQVLIDADIYEEGVGTGLLPASELDRAVAKIGLEAKPLYDADGVAWEEYESGKLPEEVNVGRLLRLQSALGEKECAIVAFPKRREGQLPFLHYAVVTGSRDEAGGQIIKVMDPSDVDGGFYYPNSEELRDYVTPELGAPVMAWQIGRRTGETETTERSMHAKQSQSLPGYELLEKPLWMPEQNGLAIPPGTKDPSSAVMADSRIARLFNDFGSIVLSRNGEQPTGYSRFVVPPDVKELSFSRTGSYRKLPFPSSEAAEAAAHMAANYGNDEDAAVEQIGGTFWLRDSKEALDGWQHTGLGMSSRQARALLSDGESQNNPERLGEASDKIKDMLSEYSGIEADDIYLYSTGMAAIYVLNKALIELGGEAPTLQFGFPYTDTYEMRKYGPHRSVNKNMIDLRLGDYDSLSKAAGDMALRSLMTELPSNPLLWSPDLFKIDEIVGSQTPVILDDTIAMFNVDDDKLPNSVAARVTSLTKFFSGAGDVMGGAVLLRAESPHYEKLKQQMEKTTLGQLWYEDAEVLATNGANFPNIKAAINDNGTAIAQWLTDEHTGESKPLAQVYHPTQNQTAEYEAVKKADEGYGGLLSLRFNDKNTAFRFFDNLRVTKGPSLGTYYTLGCLYTLLAHKPPESVEKFGVPVDLVRLSIGVEDLYDLKGRFSNALDQSV